RRPPPPTLFPYTTLFRSATKTEAAAPAPQPAPATPQPTVTLAAGAPIPAQGVALWLAADDAQPGKLASWSNGAVAGMTAKADARSEEHTSELQSQSNLVC